MRLLAGLVAGFAWETELVGDESLSARPMDRVAEPLGLMGADVRGRGARCLPPLRVRGGNLHGIDWTAKVASAQVKSAILLAGLSASGTTVVREAVTTRTHTEEMLAEAGADLTVEPWGEGRIVRLRASSLKPVDRTVPGDPSASAFFVVAGCVVPDSAVEVAGVYQRPGPPRLRRASSDAWGPTSPSIPGPPGTSTIRARPAPLRATEVRASEIPSLDEVPALAVAAAVAEGTTVFSDVGELRVKEVDRLVAVADMVEAFGAAADTSTATHWRSPASAARCAAPASTAAATTAWPWRPPSRPSRARLGRAQPHHRVRRGRRPATRASPRTWRRVTGGDRAPRPLLVAIDGPAGAGKSTVSTAVAEHLGVDRLDTGAMYRAVAALALADGIPPADVAAVAALAAASTIEVGERVTIDGRDVTDVIRSPEVGRAVSIVAANPARAPADGRAPARLGRRARRGGGRGQGHRVGRLPARPIEGLPDGQHRGAGPAARRRGSRGGGPPRPDRLDPAGVAAARGEDARRLDTTGRSVQDVVKEVLSWL